VRAYKKNELPGKITSVPVTVYSLLPASKTGQLQKGLKVAAYELSAKSVKDLENAKPVKESVSKNISVDDLTRNEYSGLVYTGYINVPADGLYNFFLSSDDGSKLWIDENEVIEHDGHHANTEKTGRIGLRRGPHAFRLAYIEDKPALALKLEYSLKDQKKQVVPSTFFWSDK
jgi:hypothetical protein